MKALLYAAIELGGTKTLCMVASCPDDLIDELRVPNSIPEETPGEVARFIKAAGTVNVNPDSLHYGTIEQNKLFTKLNGYVRTQQQSRLDQYICTPAIEGRTGMLGSLLLALPEDGQFAAAPRA